MCESSAIQQFWGTPHCQSQKLPSLVCGEVCSLRLVSEYPCPIPFTEAFVYPAYLALQWPQICTAAMDCVCTAGNNDRTSVTITLKCYYGENGFSRCDDKLYFSRGDSFCQFFLQRAKSSVCEAIYNSNTLLLIFDRLILDTAVCCQVYLTQDNILIST